MSRRTALLQDRRTGAVLTGAVLATIVVYMLPSHGLVGRPLIWLSTLMHELGHGITAWLVGGSFESFIMHPGGSGLARSGGTSEQTHALVSAGGLVGPAIASAIGFTLARWARVAQVALLAGVALLLGLAIAVAGNWLAWLFMLGLAAGLAWVGARRNPEPAQVALVFLSTQLALSVFSRGDYLFKREAETATGTFPSDVANMASALGGPFWLWGLVCGGVSILALVVGLWLFSRSYPSIGLGKMSALRKLRRRA